MSRRQSSRHVFERPAAGEIPWGLARSADVPAVDHRAVVVRGADDLNEAAGVVLAALPGAAAGAVIAAPGTAAGVGEANAGPPNIADALTAIAAAFVSGTPAFMILVVMGVPFPASSALTLPADPGRGDHHQL
jgi:hypothetical protein